MTLLFIAVGFFCGIISGLFGIGGGIVYVPFFYLFLKLDLRTAMGTSLCIIVPTALSGAVSHFRMGNIHFSKIGMLILGAVLGALVGSFIAYRLPQKALQQIYAIFLIVVAVKLLLGK